MPPETSPTPPATGGLADSPVTLAVIIGAHGVTGEVRLKVFAEDLSAHRSFNGGALTMKTLRDGPNGAIARFTEIPDRTAAERLRGTELSVPRSELPPLGEGEYYHADLIGLPARTQQGEPLGIVIGVENFGAGDVVEIERPAEGTGRGRRFMVPMHGDAVPHWDASGLTIADGWAE